jgi:hypothetical protein
MKIIFTLVAIVSIATSNLLMFKFGYTYGIKTEQRARLRRLNSLKKLLNGKV